MLHSSGAGISLDSAESAPAMQALCIKSNSHSFICTMHMFAGHYQCYDEFKTIWPSRSNLGKLTGQVVDLQWLYLVVVTIVIINNNILGLR